MDSAQPRVISSVLSAPCYHGRVLGADVAGEHRELGREKLSMIRAKWDDHDCYHERKPASLIQAHAVLLSLISGINLIRYRSLKTRCRGLGRGLIRSPWIRSPWIRSSSYASLLTKYSVESDITAILVQASSGHGGNVRSPTRYQISRDVVLFTGCCSLDIR